MCGAQGRLQNVEAWVNLTFGPHKLIQNSILFLDATPKCQVSISALGRLFKDTPKLIQINIIKWAKAPRAKGAPFGRGPFHSHTRLYVKMALAQAQVENDCYSVLGIAGYK